MRQGKLRNSSGPGCRAVPGFWYLVLGDEGKWIVARSVAAHRGSLWIGWGMFEKAPRRQEAQAQHWDVQKKACRGRVCRVDTRAPSLQKLETWSCNEVLEGTTG